MLASRAMRMTARKGGSDGVLLRRPQPGHRLGENRGVAAQRPARHVREVEPDALRIAHLGAAADLPVAGEARPHLEEVPGTVAVAGELLGGDRARAHEAQLAAENVDQLGQLVERGAPQELAEAGHAWIARELVGAVELGPGGWIFHQPGEGRLGALAAVAASAADLLAHGPELVDAEELAVLPDT